MLGAFVKYLSEHDQGTSLLVFTRALFTFCVLVPMIVFSPPQTDFVTKIRTSRLALHVFRSAMGIGAVYCFFLALRRISIANATLLFFTVPLFIPFVARVWKHERLPKKIWWGIGLSFIGVVLVIKPTDRIIEPMALVGLLSGILAAVGQYSTRLLVTTDPARRVNFYYMLFMMIASGAISLLYFAQNWDSFEMSYLLFFLGLGFSGFIYNFFLTDALKHAHPSIITSCLYFSVLVSMGLDYFYWNILPTALSFAGVVLVVVGAIGVVRMGRKP